ncbi:MAG: glycosyltransferase family 2 protein [Candidatus Omnitrophota bacterium]
MKLSVIIPAHNEAQNIEGTVLSFSNELENNKIEYEILVVNDNSTDNTEEVLKRLKLKVKDLNYINSISPNGYGFAVSEGLGKFNGDCVSIVMADMSDNPADLVRYYREMQEGYDCVFGSRFIEGSRLIEYPIYKLILNRLGNILIMFLFVIRYNDVTNAFKLYKKEVIDGVKPLLSRYFDMTVEIPLKAIIRGYNYCVIPNSWRNRKKGISKFKIKELGGRYLFVILYCLLEKWLSRGSYKKNKK